MTDQEMSWVPLCAMLAHDACTAPGKSAHLNREQQQLKQDLPEPGLELMQAADVAVAVVRLHCQTPSPTCNRWACRLAI